LLPFITCGQTSQFAYDSNGNLQAQSAEVLGAPQILGQPQTRIVAPGEPASFSVVVADTSGVRYSWFFNSTLIPGATNDTFLLPSVSATNAGNYFVTVSNSLGQFVISDVATLYIDSDGDGLPDSWEQMFLGGLGQTATGDADGDGVSNLQEFLDGTNPTNSASALYRITLLTDGGTVSAVPDQATYTNGASVTLTASGSIPFHAWTGDVLSRSNSVVLTMTNNKTLFAHFGPVTFTWTNSGAGDWNTASNWTPNLVPGSNDSVYLTMANSTVTLNTNADLADFTLGDGLFPLTFSCSGALTIRGKFSWNSGDQTGSGRTIVEAGGTLALANPSSVSLTTRTLEIGGATTWTGNGSLGLNNAVITNRVGAAFDVLGSGSIITFGGVNRFDNAGTLRKFAPGTTSFSSVAFNNFGSAQILSGTLSLDGGGLNNGTMTVPAGTGLILNSGTFSANGSSSITGAGQFTVNGGSETLAGLINVTGSNSFANGAVNLTGSYFCTNNTLTISGGTVNFDSTGVVNPMTLNLSGGTLGGGQTMTVQSAMSWTGGDMVGIGRTVIAPAATLNISVPPASGFNLNSRTLENGGVIVWTGAGNLNLNGAVITNSAGARFDVTGGGSMNFAGGAPRFDNAGTFRKLSGATTSFGLVAFNNYNLMQIQSSAISLGGGGSNNGTVGVSAGAGLALGPGTFAGSASSSITGAGQFSVNGGSVALAGLVNVSGTNTFANGTANLTGNYICTNNNLIISGGTANFDGTGSVSPTLLNLSSGTLGGGQTVTVGGSMGWTGGVMSGTGRTVIPAGATLTINVPAFSSLTLNNRTLDNGGTTIWTGTGFLNVNGAVITNRPGALFDNTVDSSLNFAGGSPRFDNAGTFRKLGSNGTTSAYISFANYGTVDIRRGILAANSGYASSSNALLNCALGGTTPGTNYGQLQVAGSVSLSGGLSVDFTNGFSPALNDVFTVLTAGVRNGGFTSFAYPSNQVSMLLSNTANSVVLRVTNIFAAPQPVLLSLQLSGSNALLTWTATSNVTYQLEKNPDLATTNWSAMPGDVIALSNTASKLDALTPSNRFYRVRVLP
jgi:hypothetical protein